MMISNTRAAVVADPTAAAAQVSSSRGRRGTAVVAPTVALLLL
jgi:hypothetical protein